MEAARSDGTETTEPRRRNEKTGRPNLTMTTMLHRLIGGLGRVLITVGALVLAFAAFQYWGTGLAEARAQQELDGQFLARLASVRNDLGDEENVSQTSAEAEHQPEPSERAERLDPAGTPAGDTAAPIFDIGEIPSIGEAAGRIIIPAIGVDKTYVRGVGRDELRKGPGHYPLTAFPGQPGNAAIAGHRTTYGAPFFDLDKLMPGDEIIVETLQGRFRYLVNEHGAGDDESDADDVTPLGHFIVDPTATWVLDDHGDSRLTLTACHPKRSAAQRIVVTATLDTTPAPPTPIVTEVVEPDLDRSGDGSGEAPGVDDMGVDDMGIDDTVLDDTIGAELAAGDSQSLDESLGWQPKHWPATALWAVLSALVALAGWALGRGWRRRPAYTLTAVPLLACLFICFTHLDRLLPAI